MLLNDLVDFYVQLWPLRGADGWCRLTWAELAEFAPAGHATAKTLLAELAEFGLVKRLESDAEGATFELLPLKVGYPGQSAFH